MEGRYGWVLYWILYPDPHDPTRISAAAAATLILAALTWRSAEFRWASRRLRALET